MVSVAETRAVPLGEHDQACEAKGIKPERCEEMIRRYGDLIFVGV